MGDQTFPSLSMIELSIRDMEDNVQSKKEDPTG
jgi:hypothetical protein